MTARRSAARSRVAVWVGARSITRASTAAAVGSSSGPVASATARALAATCSGVTSSGPVPTPPAAGGELGGRGGLAFLGPGLDPLPGGDVGHQGGVGQGRGVEHLQQPRQRWPGRGGGQRVRARGRVGRHQLDRAQRAERFVGAAGEQRGVHHVGRETPQNTTVSIRSNASSGRSSASRWSAVVVTDLTSRRLSPGLDMTRTRVRSLARHGDLRKACLQQKTVAGQRLSALR